MNPIEYNGLGTPSIDNLVQGAIRRDIHTGAVEVFATDQWVQITNSSPRLTPEIAFESYLSNKYHITPKQLREMMKIHYPEHLI